MPYEPKADIEKNKILTKLNDYFSSALDHPSWNESTGWRAKALQCFKYKEGQQWTAAELKELENNRHQPATVNNQVSVTCNWMLGQFVKQKTRIAFKGRNPKTQQNPQVTDEEVAQVLSELELYTRQSNLLEFEERDMADDGFTGGMGVLEYYITFDDLFLPEIKVRHEDCFNLFPDPESRRYDWNEDAVFICRAKWMDLDEAIELYPDYEKQLRYAVNGTTSSTDVGRLGATDTFRNVDYIDQKNQRVRLVDCYYKVKERESYCFFNDGTAVDKNEMQFVAVDSTRTKITKKQLEQLKAANPNGYSEIDRVNHKMFCGVFTYGILFDHKETKCKLFPFVPYFAYRKKNGQPYSLIELSLSMQDAINKRESKALHLLNNHAVIAEENTIVDEVEFATQLSRPDGIAVVRSGALSGQRIMVDKNVDIGNTHYAMHNGAIMDYRRITGVNPDALGERSEVRSGVGIARKQMASGSIVAPIFDNFRRTRGIEAKVFLEFVANYYSERKVFYVTDDLGASRQVVFEPKHAEVVKQAHYDVVIDDLPDTTTIQEEQLGILLPMLPQLIALGPAWTSVVLEMTSLKNKKALIDMIGQMSQPPPLEPRISFTAQLDKLTDVERAAAWVKMGAPDVAAAIGFTQPGPTGAGKDESDLIKEQLKQQGIIQKGQIDLTKSTMDILSKREQAEADMILKGMEIQKARIDLANPNNGRSNGE